MLRAVILLQLLFYSSVARQYIQVANMTLGGHYQAMFGDHPNVCMTECENNNDCFAFMYYLEETWRGYCNLQKYTSVVGGFGPDKRGTTYVEREAFCNKGAFGNINLVDTKQYSDACFSTVKTDDYVTVDMPVEIAPKRIEFGPTNDLDVCKKRCNRIPNCVMFNFATNCDHLLLSNATAKPISSQYLERTSQKVFMKRSFYCKVVGPSYHIRPNEYSNLCLKDCYTCSAEMK